MKRTHMDIRLILTVLVGALLLLDGVAGVARADSLAGQFSRTVGAQGSTINLVVAVVELIAGALILMGLFVDLGQLSRTIGIGVFILWIVVMIARFLINDFQPDTLGWGIHLLKYSIILAAIWLLRRT